MTAARDRFNPEYPRTAGMEWAPTREGLEQLDPSAHLAVPFLTRQPGSASGMSVWLADPALGDLGHTIVMSLLPDPYTIPSEPVTFDCPADNPGFVLFGSATLVGTAQIGPALDSSLATYVNVGDDTGVFPFPFNLPAALVDASGAAFTIDTFARRRILDVGVHIFYEAIATSVLAEGDPPHEAILYLSALPGGPLGLAQVGDSVAVPLQLNQRAVVTAGFGEANPAAYTATGDYRRKMWLPGDVGDLRAFRVGFNGNFDDVRVYGMQLYVVTCEETRLATAAFRYSADVPPPTLPQWSQIAPLAATPGGQGNVAVPANVPMLLAVSEATPPTGAADPADPLTGSTYGPPFQTSWLQDVRNGRFGGRRFSRGSNGAEIGESGVDRAWPIVLTDGGGYAFRGSQPYAKPYSGKVYFGNTSGAYANLGVYQSVYSPTFGTAMTRFLARRFGWSGPLNINANIGFPQTVTVEAFDALPDLGDGWREVSVPYVGSFTHFDSDQSPTFADRWEIAGALTGKLGVAANSLHLGGRADYFYEAAYEARNVVAWSGNGSTDHEAGLTFGVLTGRLPTIPTGVTVTVRDDVVAGVVGAALDDPAVDHDVPYARINWTRETETAQAGFCAYEVARRQTPDDPWFVVGRSFNPDVCQVDDKESAWGALSQWRVRRVNRDGFVSSWSTPVPDYDHYLTGGGVMTADEPYPFPADFGAELDVRVDAVLNDWTPAAAQTLLSKDRNGPGIIEIEVRPTGLIRFSVGAHNYDWPAPGFVDGTRHWLRFHGTPYSNGTGVQIIMYTSEDGEAWHYVTSVTAVHPAPFTATGPLYLGDNHLETAPVLGRVYGGRVEWNDDVLVDVDFSDWPLGGAAHTDEEGRLWSFVNGRIREPNMAPTVEVGEADCADQNSDDCEPALYFTSNRAPDRVLRLPLLGVGEEFGFPEAAEAATQRLYLRDFQAGYHPLERGGVAFSRQVLVNAIQRPTGRNGEAFRGLRDLAWEDLPYVCVRDSNGGCWYAQVVVPKGQVNRPANLHVATVGIVEVTDRPAYAEARSA